MNKLALSLSALFFIVFVNFIYEKLSGPTRFVVTADTKIIPGSELSKYVTQEEIDDFAFRYWDIDKQIQDNAFAENFRKLLKSKQTDQILKFMQDNNISIDSPLIDGVTPLMYASFYGDEATAKRLIDMGANARAQDNYKLSPLAYAIENNSTKTVKLLLDSGVRLEEAGNIQSYLDYALYDFIDGIVIDKDDIHIKYAFMDTDSKDAVRPFPYAIGNNLLEMAKMFFEFGYKPPCEFGYKNNEFDCFDILAHIPNYEPMLNLLLDNNVSGQPTSEELKEAYKKCYIRHKWAVEDKEKYIYKMNQGRDEEAEEKIKKKYDKYKYAPYSLLYEDGLLQYKPKPIDPKMIEEFDKEIDYYKQHCSDENSTFKDTESFVKWANEEKRRENVLRFLEAHKNNPAKVIYIDTNISSQDKEKLMPNKFIKKKRSKNAAER